MISDPRTTASDHPAPLRGVGLAGMSAGDPDQVARQLFDWSQRLVGIDGGILFVLDGDILSASHGFEIPARLVDGLVIDLETEGLVQRTMRHGVLHMTSGPAELPPALQGKLAWSTTVCVPLTIEETAIGVFMAGWSAPYDIGPETTLVLEGAAAMAASAIYGARLLHDVKREQHRLRLLIDHLPIPAFQFSEPNLVFNQLNAQARKLFGDVDGETIASLLARSDAEPMVGPTITAETAKRGLLTASPSRRIRVTTEDGVTRTILPRIAHFGTGGGVIMLVDVTAEANLEAQRHRFVRMISHHLRTPLTPLLAYAELLQHTDTSDPVIQQAATEIGLAVNEILAQVHRLEQISKLEPVDLGNLKPTLVTDLVESAAARATRGPGDLWIEGDDSVQVMCAPDHVRAAMIEVINNAHTHGRPPVTVQMSKAGNDVIVTFEDAGNGIPDDWASAVFTPYVDAQGGYLAPAGGRLGLGLTLARGLVEASHGGLTYEGHRFVFRLRAAA